ncbi:MAG: long-chain fatty acid--CoA ligase [Chloroflexi bacterium]|nr:long-chain fatty acid--CoA ligase [Chloroflexota bacterium]
MLVDLLLDVFRKNHRDDAMIWREQAFSYGWLLSSIEEWRGRLQREDALRSTVLSLEGDFSPNAVSLLFALIETDRIVVPLTSSVEVNKPEFREIAQVESIIKLSGDDQAFFERTQKTADHPLLLESKRKNHPGLILFSSGSTGKPKAAVHDFVPILDKFRTPRPRKRMMAFLLFDHIGGLNTLLHTLSNGGCIVTVSDRSPDSVLAAVAKHRVQVLPTSPSFINTLLFSEAYKQHDLSSLERITYGTEVMPESTLKRMHEILPGVELLQTYGLSEVGILRSRSRSSDSLWVRVGGEGFETRVVDGMLEIKARSAMLGYLNAPSPFTEDGWFKTGDVVEVDGEWLRILGRKSGIINVGGQKVYPAEVESVIQQMKGVEDAAVSGKTNPLLGQIVVATVRVNTGETRREFMVRMRLFCQDRLQSYKIPQKVNFAGSALYNDRFKKVRNIWQ